MFRTALVVLATVACTQARPQHHTFPSLPGFNFPSPQASGQSNSGITKGETFTLGGKSTVEMLGATTSGQAKNGGSNIGNANAGTLGFNGPFGSGSTAKTNSESVQNSNPLFPAGFPAFPDFGAATGNAGSQLTQGKTTGPDGSQTTITQLGSSAGGSAENGGTSVNKASGSTTSVDTIEGSHTSSNVDAHSSQTTRG